ncbi:MAG: ABC transporter substrate-binding protein, partial [Dehalococcoidales bacterium]|nr:ABC transporter substrate-binding protein [Dehalococcoidales bacterium]
FSIEQVVSSNPAVIIVQTMAGGQPTISKETLAQHPSWGQMAAVQQGKVYFLNGDLISRPGPRIIQGLEAIAMVLHPEVFK